MVAVTPPIDWLLVQLAGDEKPGAAMEPPDDESEAMLSDPEAEEPAPDSDGFHIAVQPPETDEVEIVSIQEDFANAETAIVDAISAGYWAHGPGYFPALQSGIDSPLANEYQGSEEPLRVLSPEGVMRLHGIAKTAIDATQEQINAALAEVEQHARQLALSELARSEAQVVDTTGRYIMETQTRREAQRWLETAAIAAGAHTFRFVRDPTIGLVGGLFAVWTAYRELTEDDQALARTMRQAAPQMQQIAAARWQFLRDRDRTNTPRDTYRSRDYGIELMCAANTKHPDLVDEAIRKYPEPEQVTAARARVIARASALTATLVDEGDEHPLLYRIWSPRLASELHSRFDRPDVHIARIDETFNLRYVVADALRSTWSASRSLSQRYRNDSALVWRYPILIQRSLDELDLPLDSFARIAAEHRLDEIAEQERSDAQVLMRASQVLTAASIAVRFIPVPAISVPAAIILAAVDMVVSGLALLREYIAASDTRDAFRAFLVPGDTFAASDGSYLGVAIGAAFLLFGLTGFKRTSLLRPSRSEIALTAGLFAGSEYVSLQSAGGQ